MLRVAVVRSVQELVWGSYTSGVWTMLELASAPDVTRTRPSARVVAVGYQRAWCIGARVCQRSVAGLKAVTVVTPSPPLVDVPPTTRMRPSARTAWPAQNRSAAAFGTWVVAPVLGSSRYCWPPWLKSPWKVRTLPVFVSAAWMDTSGHACTGPHEPTTLASGPELLTVTVTVAAVAVLPAASRAMAERVCDPAAAVLVSHAVEYGAEVSSAPRLTSSRTNWTPTTPTLSDAAAVTFTVPATVALFAGAEMLTEGRVPSGAGSAVVNVASPETARLPDASADFTWKWYRVLAASPVTVCEWLVTSVLLSVVAEP